MTHDDIQYYPPRAYTKQELAHLYSPKLTDTAARARLRRWIEDTPNLLDDLLAIGYNPRSHHFTVRQVQLIYRYLGEP